MSIDPFRRKKEDDVWKYFREIDEMFDKIFKSIEEEGEEGPFFYGFSWTTDEEGKPVVREFGNISPSVRGIKRSNTIKPYYDVISDPKGNKLSVIVEVPGAEKDKINVEVAEKSVHVEAQGMNRKYEAEIGLDVDVNPDSAKASFVNGILQINFEPKSPFSEKGKRIQIE
ncbi:MAG: archaeal heat shock protein Hsp20 [Conexivisphaerales archaeon]